MKEPKKSWEVKLECVVTKIVITDECTEQEARENPFGNSGYEIETGQIDWKVKSVQPND